MDAFVFNCCVPEATNGGLEQQAMQNNNFNDNNNLDDIWLKVIAMLELPSTKMLLSQQAKLINLNSNSAEIAISDKWINMIQSRKKLIEDAFYKATGSSTKIVLRQQKDTSPNQTKEKQEPIQTITKNEIE